MSMKKDIDDSSLLHSAVISAKLNKSVPNFERAEGILDYIYRQRGRFYMRNGKQPEYVVIHTHDWYTLLSYPDVARFATLGPDKPTLFNMGVMPTAVDTPPICLGE